MPTTLVQNETQLLAALNKAHGGDTIELAGGSYGTVVLTNYHFSSAVTLTSQSPLTPAIMNGLKMANDSGITISNVELTSVGSSDPYFAFRVSTSQNISFKDLTVHGDLSATATHQVNGFYIATSNNVTISNSIFTDLDSAITANYNNNLTITTNSFYNLDKGAVEAGADTNFKVTNNNFSDFQTAMGIHADCIQIYTTGLSTGSSNITITGNLMDRGAGDASQGILIQDEVGNKANTNITIDDNTIIGMQWNSIFVNHAAGTLQVENNVVESFAGFDVMTGGTTNFSAWIRLASVSGASIIETGNSSQYYLSGQTCVATPAGNGHIGSVQNDGLATLQSWAATNGSELGLLPSPLLSALGYHGIASLVGVH